MMTLSQIETATLDQLTDELAAAGWDSTQQTITEARDAVRALLEEVGGSLARNVFTGKNYSITFENAQFTLHHPVSEDEVFDTFDELAESYPVCEQAREFFYGQDEAAG